MSDIRKISVGSDYKTAMHYVHGQSVLNSKYKIHLIKHDKQNQSFKIYIEELNGNIIVLWKEFTFTIPVSIEYNINL